MKMNIIQHKVLSSLTYLDFEPTFEPLDFVYVPGLIFSKLPDQKLIN